MSLTNSRPGVVCGVDISEHESVDGMLKLKLEIDNCRSKRARD